MSLQVADRVKETTAAGTTGTGTVNLAGAVAGFQTFVAGIGTTNKTYYAIVDADGIGWEVGIGTVTDASPDTLSRDTILASSNSGSAVSLSSGAHTVFATYPADKAVYLDDSSLLSPSIGLNHLVDVSTGGNSSTTKWSLLIGNNGFGVAPSTASLTSGNAFSNIGIGYYALKSMIDYASYNTAIGAYCGHSVTTGDGNAFLGSFYTGYKVTTGNYNFAVGANAFRGGGTGSHNIAIGSSALAGDDDTPSSGSNNIAIGYRALEVTTAALSGGKNVAIGA